MQGLRNRVSLIVVVVLSLAGVLLPSSAGAKHSAVIRDDLFVTMSDDVDIAVRVFRPNDDGRYPVMLSFHPYGGARSATEFPAFYASDFDMVRVYVDVRGTGGSSGEFCLLCPREQEDAHDLVEWVAGLRDLESSYQATRPPWSDGNVAIFGQSYGAIAALLAAARTPRGLRTVVAESSASDLYRDAAWHNGMLSQFFVSQWTAYQIGTSVSGSTSVNAAEPTTTNIDELASSPDRLAQRAGNEKVLDTVLTNPFDGQVYQSRSPYHVRDKIEVPVLLMDGWQDGFSQGAIRNLQGIPNARLVMGPYGHSHGSPTREPQTAAPEPLMDRPVDRYGNDVRYAVRDFWLEQHLSGSQQNSMAYYKARPVNCDPASAWKICYFDRGAKSWKTGNSWPLPGAGLEEFYLGRAGEKDLPYEGTLTAGLPDGLASEPREFVYDPTLGVTETFSRWGEIAASPQVTLDQRPDQARTLTYTTSPLESPLEIAGPMELRFFASTTAEDTDWVVKVSRVATDGSARLISTGFLRASHRRWDEAKSAPGAPWITNLESDSQAPNSCTDKPATGCINEYRVDIWDIAWTIQPGERLRIAVSSGDSPGHTPSPWAAVNTIFHGQEYPSRLLVTHVPYGVPKVALDVTPEQITGNGPISVSAKVSDVEGIADIASIDLVLSDERGRVLAQWSRDSFQAIDDELALVAEGVNLSGPSPWTVTLTATDTDGASASTTATVVRIHEEETNEEEDPADESEEAPE